MKKFVGSVLLTSTILMTSSALSADIDPVPAPAVAAPYDWSGPYFGLQIGGIVDGDSDLSIAGVQTSLGNSTSGLIGGVFGGYNFQKENWVFGLDTDFSISGAGADVGGADFDLDTLSTARVRVGYAFDRVLPFVTGGLAYSFTDLNNAGALVADDSDVVFGWTAGAGVEYAATDNVHFRVQYNYVDLQSADFNVGGASFNVNPEDLHIVRAGVSIKTGFIWNKILGR